MVSTSICRIDPATARVIESFEVPNEGISLIGLEVVENHIYVLGTDANGQGILYRLNRP